MQVIALFPIVKPFFFPIKTRLVLVKVIEIDQAVGSVTLGTAIVTIHLAAADTLTAWLFVPGELVGLEVGAGVRTITPGLRFAVTARAPKVFLALLHVNLEAAPLRHVGQCRRLQISLVGNIGHVILTSGEYSYGHWLSHLKWTECFQYLKVSR